MFLIFTHNCGWIGSRKKPNADGKTISRSGRMNSQRMGILQKVVVVVVLFVIGVKIIAMADRVSERSMLCAEIRESSLITQITILKSGGIGKVNDDKN